MFVPIILGSDKTTVSVATGQNDFYPLYLSIGNVTNHVRRAHSNAVVLIGFLSIPKSLFLFFYILSYLLQSCSGQGTSKQQRISRLSSSDVPCIASWNLEIIKAWDDKAWGVSLCRWSLSSRHLWYWALRCWLSRAGVSLLYRTKLVSTVSKENCSNTEVTDSTH